MEINDDALYDMSDEELKAAFDAAKSGQVEVDEIPSEEVEKDVAVDEIVDEETEEVEVDDEEIELEEEVDTEDTEQPGEDEDSEDSDETTDEEDETTEEEESTEEPDEDTEDTQESEDEESQPEPEVKKYTYKANGQEFEFTEDEIKEQFGKVFGQSMNYTQKMQEIAPWRKTISALKENEVSHEDVNLLIDVLKGNKDAITDVIRKSGIDPMELDINPETPSQYNPNEYGKSEHELAIDDVVSSIEKDQEFSITQHVVDKQWDSASRQVMAQNPQMIQGLHNDIKSGLFDRVSPVAMKLKVLDGGSKSDLEYYIQAGAQVTAQEKQQADSKLEAERKANAQAEREKVKAVKTKQVQTKQVKAAATKRKAAATTKKAAGKKDVLDLMDDLDEGFEKWEQEYKRKYG